MPLLTSCLNRKMQHKMPNILVMPTPNEAAKALLPKSITDDKAFYPSESTIKNLEVYNNLGQKWLGIYNDIYLQVKMYRK